MTTDPIAAARALLEKLEPPSRISALGYLQVTRKLKATVATLADSLEAERAEVERLTKGSICEVAATNQSVMEYMRHWEGRAEKAEAERDTLVAAAYEAAADACDDYPTAAPSEEEWTRYDRQIEYSRECIRDLTPADAQAALDKLLAEARNEGWRAGRDAAVQEQSVGIKHPRAARAEGDQP